MPGRDVLIGGWYRMAECDLSGYGWTCPYDEFADNPAQLHFPSTEAVRLVGAALTGSGAVIVHGHLDGGTCDEIMLAPGQHVASCPRSLIVTDVVWQGDPLTEAGPIGTVELLSGLAATWSDFQPNGQLAARCPDPWPAQTWYSATSPVRVVAILPTALDAAHDARLLTEQQINSAGCGGTLEEGVIWVVRENAVIGVDALAADSVGLVGAKLAGALPLDMPSAPATRPLTEWQVLQRLAGLRGRLSNLLVPGQTVCGDGLPPATYALDLLANHAYFPDGSALS